MRTNASRASFRLLQLLPLMASVLAPVRLPAQSVAVIPSMTGAVWRYNQSNNLDGVNWTAPEYDDTQPLWQEGPALLSNDTGNGTINPLIGTLINGPRVAAEGVVQHAYYFRTRFVWNQPALPYSTLTLDTRVDDGAIFFLNGVEILRVRVDPGVPVQFAAQDFANGLPCMGAGDADCVETFSGTDNTGALRMGTNVLAAIVYQEGGNSSDITFGASLSITPPRAPTIVDAAQPRDREVVANRRVLLACVADGLPAPTYQWCKDGLPIDPMVNASATEATFVISNMSPADVGAYQCKVSNPLGNTNSRAALVTFSSDTNPPVVVRCTASATLDRFYLEFDEALDLNAAEDEFLYAITDGVNVLNVLIAVLTNENTVCLLTDPQTADTPYVITVQASMLDLAGNATLAAQDLPCRSWALGACNGPLFEAFDTASTPGTAINLLTNHPNFPNNPRERAIIASLDSREFYPNNDHEQYGGRIRGLFIPPISGNWVFYFGSDDAGRVFLNPTGPSAAGKELIIEEPGCCNLWGQRTSNTRFPGGIPLAAGVGYYIETIWKEGGGGDYAKVAARLFGQPVPEDDPETVAISPNAIPGALLGYPAAPAGIGGDLMLTMEPQDASVFANSTVTFTVAVSNPNDLPVCYQWKSNGVDIAGATGPSHTTPLLTVGDDGSTYCVVASIIGDSATSRQALLRVMQDTNPPACLSVSGTAALSNVLVRFSEVVELNGAEDEFNYSVPGHNVDLAVLQPNGRDVLLSLSPSLEPDSSFDVTIQNVTDLSGNAISPNPCTLSGRTWVVSCGFARQENYFNIGGVLISDLRASPSFPGSPNLTRLLPELQINTVDEFDNYGARLSGWLRPPVSGNYNLYMSSDDAGELWLSTDASPANLQLIAFEPVWNGRRDWVGTARRNAAAPENRSTTLFPGGIPLVAGQMYYFEALMKEGGGGDNLQVTWQLPGAPAPINGDPPIQGAFLATLADPVGAFVNITTNPVDAAVCKSIQGLPVPTPGPGFTLNTASFTVNAAASGQVFIQWQCDRGAGFADLPGANSRTLNLNPAVGDDGNRYRAVIYTPGAVATSAAALLTVVQFNTPPSFSKGPDVVGTEDSSPVSIPGWATGIRPHSIPRPTIQTFDALPPNSTLYDSLDAGGSGAGTISGGVFRMNTPVNSQGGHLVMVSPGGINTYPTFQASWKSYIGDGAGGGADGYSFQVGTDLPGSPGQPAPAYNFPGEDGAGSGLRVTVDTFDNGADSGFPDLGIDIRWQGVKIAHTQINKDAPGNPTFLRRSTFVDANLTVDAAGNAVFTYDGVSVAAALPGYSGVTANTFSFGGRTGGANDNQWIDDLTGNEWIEPFLPASAATAEAGQSVKFIVTTDRPELFSAQPAISPNGTLTYTPAPDQCGRAVVTVVAMDNGGSDGCGGRDMGDPCDFFIDIQCVNDCPVGVPGTASTMEDMATGVTLAANDVDGDTLLYLVAFPAHGTLTGTLPNPTYTPDPDYCGTDTFLFAAWDGQCSSVPVPVVITIVCKPDCPTASDQLAMTGEDTPVGIALSASDVDGDALSYAITAPPSHGTLSGTPPNLTYTPAANYCGPDRFSYSASDGTCSASATVHITVRCSNDVPTAVIKIHPECDLSPWLTGAVLISHDNSNAFVRLDGRMSSDPEGDALSYAWFAGGAVTPFSSAAVTSNALPLGANSIVLEVSDGTQSGSASVSITVVSACEALECLAAVIEQSQLTRREKRPLLATLSSACAKFERGQCREGEQLLAAFKNKVRAQLWRSHRALAEQIIRLTDRILDCLDCQRKHAGDDDDDGGGETDDD